MDKPVHLIDPTTKRICCGTSVGWRATNYTTDPAEASCFRCAKEAGEHAETIRENARFRLGRPAATAPKKKERIGVHHALDTESDT
jgi:hypothetical protein